MYCLCGRVLARTAEIIGEILSALCPYFTTPSNKGETRHKPQSFGNSFHSLNSSKEEAALAPCEWNAQTWKKQLNVRTEPQGGGGGILHCSNLEILLNMLMCEWVGGNHTRRRSEERPLRDPSGDEHFRAKSVTAPAVFDRCGTRPRRNKSRLFMQLRLRKKQNTDNKNDKKSVTMPLI